MEAPPTAVDATFPLNTFDSALNEELYGDEMCAVVWRLGVESVKLKEFVLAEVFFAMHMLLENPDLYFAFYVAPAPDTLDEILATVIFSAAAPLDASHASELVNAGRLWGSFYASHAAGVGAEEYDTLRMASSIPSVATVTALLGLGTSRNCIRRFGCVPYSIAIENTERTPRLVDYHNNTYMKGTHSLVLTAHAFRLARKPLVDQRWAMTVAERVAVTRLGLTEELDVALAAIAMSDDVFGAVSTSSTYIPAPSATTLRDVIDAISVSGAVLAYTEERPADSYLRYSASVSAAQSTASGLLKALSPDMYLKLYKQSAKHTNVYATIEFGRFMTLLSALKHRSLTMQTFGDSYLAESRVLNASDHIDVELDDHAGKPEWSSASRGGLRDRTDEVASNNVFDDTLDAGDPALRAAVGAAVAAAAGEPDVVTGGTAQLIKVRHCVAAATAAADYPLTRLCKYHPPAHNGNGTPTTPHVTLPSALQAIFVGERVELLAGRYDESHLVGIEGTLTDEIIVCPRGYMRMLGSDPDLRLRPFDEQDRAQFDRVLVGVAADRPSNDPQVSFHHCANIDLRGVVFNEAYQCVRSVDSPECTLHHCELTSRMPYTTTSDVVIAEETNVVVSTASGCARRLQAGMLPHQSRFPGYLVALALFLFFLFFVLFLTAGFTDEKANLWIIRCAVTTVVSAVFIEPVTNIGRTGIVVVTTALQSATGVLRNLAPINFV
jgi:hypothetical protein